MNEAARKSSRVIIAACLAVVAALLALSCIAAPRAYAEEYVSAQVSDAAMNQQTYACLDKDGYVWRAESSGSKNKTPWIGSNTYRWSVKPEQFALITTLFIDSDVQEIGQMYFEYYKGADSSETDESNSRDIREQFPNLQKVVFKTDATGASSVNKIGDSIFTELTQLKEVSGLEKTQVNRIGKKVFKDCSALTSITLPSKLTLIGESAFYGCSNLKSTIGLENTSVTTLSENAFRDCRELTTAAMPSTLVKIDWNAFAGCINLTSVSLNDNLASLEPGAFYGCELLPSIDIPQSVNNIGREAFRYCSKLTKVRVRSQTYPELGLSAFSNTPITDDAYSTTAFIYVPDGKVSAYKAASGWKSYESRIVSELYLNPIDISKATASVAKATYTGEAVMPAVTVTYNSQTLEEGEDYTYSYSNNVNAGVKTASVTITGMKRYKGTLTKSFTINKAPNPLKASAKSKTLTYKRATLKKSSKKVKNLKVSNAVGSVTYKNVSKNKVAKKFKVNAKKGQLIIPKKTKAGTYAVKIKVTAAGNSNFKAKSKTVTYKIKVKK